MKEDSLILRRQPLVLPGSVTGGRFFSLHAGCRCARSGRTERPRRHTLSGVEIKTDACVLAIRPNKSWCDAYSLCQANGDRDPKYRSASSNHLYRHSRCRRKPQSLSLPHQRWKRCLIATSGALHFTDHSGKTFLSEIAGTRRLTQATVQGEPTFAVEQDFISPPGEHLFGSGEFQDGFLDIRDLPRRLTQVNSQIAIPFLLSSKGYGILWHNYGLTDLNPADERVVLTRSSPARKRRRM